MKTAAFASKPDEIVMAMSITMTVGEWRKLQEQIAEGSGCTSYPGWRIIRSIEGLIAKSLKNFDSAEEWENG